MKATLAHHHYTSTASNHQTVAKAINAVPTASCSLPLGAGATALSSRKQAFEINRHSPKNCTSLTLTRSGCHTINRQRIIRSSFILDIIIPTLLYIIHHQIHTVLLLHTIITYIIPQPDLE